MNIEAIQRELCKRLKNVVVNTYPTPQAAVDHPCAVIDIPTVESFHVTHTNLCRSSWDVTMYAGRGDTPDAMALLCQWLSTDTELSVLKALEGNADAWSRLTVDGTSGLSSGAESLSLTFNISIDA